MIINGVQKEYEEGISLAEMLEKEQFCQGKIAVEKNGEIVPRAEYDTLRLKKEDVIEVVSFVGGG